MDLRVSIVIPAYNAAAYIGETLKSVFSQTVPASEVIVVDDGSTDDLDRVLGPFKREITLIRIPNSGVNVARNTGAERATGDWLGFIDSDDILLPEFIERQLRLIEAAGNLRSTMVDHRNVVNGVWAERTHFSYAPPDFWNVKRRNFGEAGFAIDESLAGRLPVFQPCLPCSSLISRDLFDAMQGWDLRMNRAPGGQDTEFHLRRLDAAPIGVVPVVLAGYRRHPGQWTTDEVYQRSCDIDSWLWIAGNVETGRRHARQIIDATERMKQELLMTAFHDRRFDVCRQWRRRTSLRALPAGLSARIALTALPDAVLNRLVKLASSTR